MQGFGIASRVGLSMWTAPNRTLSESHFIRGNLSGFLAVKARRGRGLSRLHKPPALAC